MYARTFFEELDIDSVTVAPYMGAERMGWLPSAPQLGRNPLSLKAEADKAGLSPAEFTVQALGST